MTTGLLFTAFSFGLRHGLDWDHIAAIADLSGTASDRRRGYRLSLLYALGHAAVVLVLGASAIAVGETLPTGLDALMRKLVGLTLLGLGVWVIFEIARHGPDFRLRSRWMLLIDGTFAGLHRVRGRTGGGPSIIETQHTHDHSHEVGPHSALYAHDHSHHSLATSHEAAQTTPNPSSGLSGPWAANSHTHSHRHAHKLMVSANGNGRYGAGTATAIGILHGVGVESPTQIAVFVASTSVVGEGPGLLLLLSWVVGLFTANSVLALLAGHGLLHAQRNSRIYRAVALVVAAASITMGLFYLADVPLEI